jgi:hypothetical protein
MSNRAEHHASRGWSGDREGAAYIGESAVGEVEDHSAVSFRARLERRLLCGEPCHGLFVVPFRRHSRRGSEAIARCLCFFFDKPNGAFANVSVRRPLRDTYMWGLTFVLNPHVSQTTPWLVPRQQTLDRRSWWGRGSSAPARMAMTVEGDCL